MKRTAILALAVLTLAFAGEALAHASHLIPSFHWTYPPLGGRAPSGLPPAPRTPGHTPYHPYHRAPHAVMARDPH